MEPKQSHKSMKITWTYSKINVNIPYPCNLISRTMDRSNNSDSKNKVVKFTQEKIPSRINTSRCTKQLNTWTRSSQRQSIKTFYCTEKQNQSIEAYSQCLQCSQCTHSWHMQEINDLVGATHRAKKNSCTTIQAIHLLPHNNSSYAYATKIDSSSPIKNCSLQTAIKKHLWSLMV